MVGFAISLINHYLKEFSELDKKVEIDLL